MDLSNEQKIAHLLRRFGFGAGRRAMAEYVPLGVEGTIDRLFSFGKKEDRFPVTVWESHVQPDGSMQPGPTTLVRWWLMRMTATDQPLRDKLAVFWHSYLAVSAAKVGWQSLNDYLDRISRLADAPYYELLRSVSFSPAMVHWLDSRGSIPAHPNENFGRELLELFTLGIGNYTEKDVQEIARCFVGLGFQYAYSTGPEGNEYLKRVATDGMPLVSVSISPDLADHRPKSILGKTANFSADDVLKMLVEHPATGRRIVSKLWAFFVSERPPSKADSERLEKVWHDGGYRVLPVLREMTKLPKFWSEATVRTLPKSPLDYSVPIARQFGMGQYFVAQRKPNATPLDPISREAVTAYKLMSASMRAQGLSLLYPEDAAGWNWGSNWISSATMQQRISYLQVMLGSKFAEAYLKDLSGRLKGLDSATAIGEIAIDLDLATTPEQKQVLVDALAKQGGPEKAFATPTSARESMVKLAPLISSIPGFHLA